MRIIPDGDGVEINGQSGDSLELLNIATRLMPEWLRLFANKNADYGSESAKILGVRGQYADINRKMLKLKRSLWDGEQLQFEDSDEVIMDLIGHLFLTLHMIRFKEETDRRHAYSDMSTDEFVERFIEELGGPEQALRVSATLSEALSSRITNRCREMLHGPVVGHIVESAWTPNSRITVSEGLARLSGEAFAQADAEQHGADEGYPDEAAASPYADEEDVPPPTLLDLIDQSNKLADAQREIANKMYRMTRGV